ncbi:hypothetical protein SDC9_124812 [bioreactor metagenome]|uniref:Uncharacterized protein n=1 Tax=bioreactor metagenome TaxID=1076179 RepID=A0A645CLJ8_9ZZZZ
MKAIKPGSPGKVAGLAERIVAARHRPPPDVLGTHGQLCDFAGLRCEPANHVGHAPGVQQLFGQTILLIGVFGIGSIEQGDAVGEAFVAGGHSVFRDRSWRGYWI